MNFLMLHSVGLETQIHESEDIEPITVAAYIEILQRQAAPPTVKQHMAAIRMLFSWLTEKGVLAMNRGRRRAL
jgi:site-specific recombinase XerD